MNFLAKVKISSFKFQKNMIISEELKQNNIHYSWDRIKEILSSTHRVTTSMRCKDGTTLHIRQSELLNEEQKEIYNILGIKHKAGETTRIYI